MDESPFGNYAAIRLVVRAGPVIPLAAGLTVFALLLLAAWWLASPALALVSLAAGPLVAFLTRLLVEIVAVIADTLLPR